MRRWLEALLAWLRRSFSAAGRPEPEVREAPVALLHLGDSAQPLLARFVEPAIHVTVRDTVPLVRLSDSREISAALYHNRVVAIRYHYPYQLTDAATEHLTGDVERFLPAKTRATHDYQLVHRPDGWLLATPDCPESCLAAVE
jgi:hypothetical protein